MTMNLNITNPMTVALPMVSPDTCWSQELAPGTTSSVSGDGAQVIIIGDKPDVLDQFKQAAGVLFEVAKRLLTRGDTKNMLTAGIEVTIQNNGPKAVRVMLGSGTDYTDVAPGVGYQAVAVGYIEIREMGNVVEDPNQHEAA